MRRAQYRAASSRARPSSITRAARSGRGRPTSRDLLHGTVQRFHPDGRLKEKQTYREGKPLGPPVEYDGKGRPKAAKPGQPAPGKKPGWRKKMGWKSKP